MIPVVVISLRRSTDRRDVMSAHLGRLGIPFSYFDGVDGSQMTATDVAALRPPRPLRPYRFPLTRGEIGCAASYLTLLRQIASGPDEHVCVVEDDAEFINSAADFLDEDFLRGLPKFDVLRMHNDSRDDRWSRRLVARLGDRRIYAPMRVAFLTAGQIFSRAGAARVAAGMIPLLGPIDHVLYHDMQIFGLRLLELRPAVVTQRCVASVIGDDRSCLRELHKTSGWGGAWLRWLARQMRTPLRWLGYPRKLTGYLRRLASYARAWGIRALAEALRTGSNYEKVSEPTVRKKRGRDRATP